MSESGNLLPALPEQASVLSSLSLLCSSPLFPASEFLREKRQDLLMCVKQNHPNTLWELRALGGRHGLFICSYPSHLQQEWPSTQVWTENFQDLVLFSIKNWLLLTKLTPHLVNQIPLVHLRSETHLPVEWPSSHQGSRLHPSFLPAGCPGANGAHRPDFQQALGNSWCSINICQVEFNIAKIKTFLCKSLLTRQELGAL